MIDKQSQIWRAKTLINTLCYSGYFGSVTLQFEHGNIVCIAIDEHKRMSVPEVLSELEARLENGEVITVRKAPRSGDSGVSLVSLERKGPIETVLPVAVNERIIPKA